MLDKVKVTISREDGSPICGLVQEPEVHFLTDNTPFLVVKKDGETVESAAVSVSGLLEFTLAALDGLSAAVRDALCDSYGLERSGEDQKI